jgi:hypothetical protein
MVDMADDNQPIIQIPDDDELFRIAQAAIQGQMGTDQGPGDLPQWDEGDTHDTPIESDKRLNASRSPIRGAVAYLHFLLPNDCYLLFSAWDERQAQKKAETPEAVAWDAVREPDKIVDWIRGMAGRDVEADEMRNTDERHYWFGGLFRGLTYKKLIVDTHMRGFETQLKDQLRLVRSQQRDRIRQRLGSEWTDEAIDDLLGPQPDDE